VNAPLPATPKLGLFAEPASDYFTSGALGSTEIRAYLQSEEGYRLRYIERHPLAQFNGSDATELGTSVHMLLEDEGEYSAKHPICPEEFVTERGISTSKACKAWQAEHVMPGERLITPAENAKIRFLVDRIRANPVAARLMAGGRRELTGRVRDPHTGLYVQARFDVYHEEWTADYKTTGSPLSKFKWSVRDFLLHVQGAIYDAVRVGLTGKRVPFFWIVQSTVWPFECRVIECATALLDAGMAEVDRALDGIANKKWGVAQEAPDVLEGVPS
jgi:hypothetical protein